MDVDVSPLRDLAQGDLHGWEGVDPGWTREVVELVLIPATAATNASSPYSGPLGYGPTAGAPHGLTVEYDEGRVAYLTIVAPRLSRPPDESLGTPELTLPSLLEGASEQWAYPGRGLACHVAVGSSAVAWLYAFVPMSKESYGRSPLSQVRTLRHRTGRVN